MKKTGMTSPEWWVNLAVDLIDLKAGSVAVDLSKLLGNEEPDIKQQIVDHYNRNIKEVDEYPLRINGKLTLKTIYISPIAILQQVSTEATNNQLQDIDSLIPCIIDLLEENVNPIIVHGQPGHGKTSAMKILARALVADAQGKKKDRPLVLFYEFKDLHDLERNEFAILSQVTPFTKNENFFIGRNTVIILDGMDERIISGDDRGFKNFLRHMFDLQKRINQEHESSLRLILTGRSLFIENIRGEFPEEYRLLEILDFSDDQLDLWLEKFNKITENTLTATELDERHLEELKKQPVLLTICATILTDHNGKQLFQKHGKTPFNKLQVYEKIIKWTYQGKNHADSWIEEEYNSFLQAVGFVLFAQSEGVMTTSRLQAELNKIKDLFSPSPLSRKNTDINDELKKLSICFFFDGHENNSFSFIHKSIQDYLVSIAIVHVIENIIEVFNTNRVESSCQRMARELYLLLGHQCISAEDHWDFLSQKLRNNLDLCQKFVKLFAGFSEGLIEHRYFRDNTGVICTDPFRTEAMITSNMLQINYLCMLILGEKQINIGDIILTNNRIWNAHNISRINHLLCSYSCNFNLSFIKLKFAENEYFSHIFCYRADMCNASLCYINLSYADLRNANLRSADLSYANLHYTCLQQADLFGAKLNSADLSYADLRGSLLSRTDLRNADLNYADLCCADLENANLSCANLCDADLGHASLNGADLRKADLRRAILSGVDLCPVDLRGADLSGADLRNVDLSRANLLGVKLNEVNLCGTVLKRFNFSNADFYSSDMSCADLTDANFSNANLGNSDLSNTNFSNANFNEAVLRYADLNGTNLTRANLCVADLSRTDLNYATLNNATLNYADLSYADLRKADLSNADLRDTNFRGADLSNTILRNAKYNDMTIFPDGFIPEDHEMKLIED